MHLMYCKVLPIIIIISVKAVMLLSIFMETVIYVSLINRKFKRIAFITL